MKTVEQAPDWFDVCRFERLLPGRGVCALVDGEQVAVFRLGTSDEVRAISNYDPFSRAFVLSRGIVGTAGDRVKVASPVYKQSFDLRTGEAIDVPDVRVPTYDVRVVSSVVQVRSRVRRERAPVEPRAARRVPSGPLTGFRIAICEHREHERMVEILESRGATVVSCPLVAMDDAEEPAEVARWLRDLIDNQMRACVFFTGEGVRRLLAAADRLGIRDEALRALAGIETFTRGPKPARALREVGILPTHTVDVPTSTGVLESLRARNLAGTAVGVQLYPRSSSKRIIQQLKAAGVDARGVWPYTYRNAADETAVRQLVTQLASGQIEVIAFTSRSQIDALYGAVGRLELKPALDAGLRRTRIAAIGPVVASALRSRGLRPGIVPSDLFFMKTLVKEIVAASVAISAA